YYVGSRASDGFPGQTIGIVGLGRIGTRVAQLLAPWRARIIAYDPYVPPAHFLTHGVTPADSPLRKLGDRVLLSPHSASYTEGGELRQGVAGATRSVVTALKGGIPDNVSTGTSCHFGSINSAGLPSPSAKVAGGWGYVGGHRSLGQ